MVAMGNEGLRGLGMGWTVSVLYGACGGDGGLVERIVGADECRGGFGEVLRYGITALLDCRTRGQ